MQEIQFYFDPSCPWCWITSRWLVQVQKDREIKIEWLPFSLALKNKEMDGPGDSPYGKSHRSSHRVLRVIEALAEKELTDRGQLYSAFGIKHFVDQREFDDQLINEVLSENKFSQDYIEAADTTDYDSSLEQNLANAIEIVGDDVGVPLIIFADSSGNKNGYFGPVITKIPNKEEGLDLWDGLIKLGSNSSFFELKRTRTVGPDVVSTG